MKKEKGNVKFLSPKVKKSENKRKEQTYFIRLGTVRSESSIRPGAVSKKKLFFKRVFFK